MGEFLYSLHLAAFHNLAVLLLQFGHGGGTGAAGALVRAHVDAANVAELFNGLEYHYHEDGGAVGVGNDAARTHQGIRRIAFRHHQGDILVHAEGAGIVYHYAAVLGNIGGKLLGGAGSG